MDELRVRPALTIVAFAGALFALREGGVLLAPLLLSVLLAYALEPFVTVLMRIHCSRTVAVTLVYTVIVVAGLMTGRAARRQVIAFIDTLPAMVDDIQRAATEPVDDGGPQGGPSGMDRLRSAATEIDATVRTTQPPVEPGVVRVTRVSAPFSLRDYLADASVTVAYASARTVAIVFLTLLLLLSGDALKRKAIAIAGPGAQKQLTHDVIKAIDRQIERYLVARVLISAMVAGATWLGLWALGVRQPFVLGVLAGVLNVMPFLGPAAAVGIIGLAAFVQFHTLGITAAAVGVSGLVAALEGNLISPWLTSRAGELNTVAVFVSVLFWGWMWDVWGLVLAIPIMVAMKAAADHIEPLQPLGELLGR